MLLQATAVYLLYQESEEELSFILRLTIPPTETETSK